MKNDELRKLIRSNEIIFKVIEQKLLKYQIIDICNILYDLEIIIDNCYKKDDINTIQLFEFKESVYCNLCRIKELCKKETILNKNINSKIDNLIYLVK